MLNYLYYGLATVGVYVCGVPTVGLLWLMFDSIDAGTLENIWQQAALFLAS